MSNRNYLLEINYLEDDIIYLENQKKIELERFEKISKYDQILLDSYYRILNRIETDIYNTKCKIDKINKIIK